jgi:hypothetical protein
MQAYLITHKSKAKKVQIEGPIVSLCRVGEKLYTQP